MVRAFALGIGITLCVLGAECLIVEKAFFSSSSSAAEAPPAMFTSAPPPAEAFVPPEWAPWTLLSIGVVVSLYSFTIARQG